MNGSTGGLIAQPIDARNRSALQNFNCGNSKSAMLAAEWISGPQLIVSLSRGNQVWAYYTNDDVLVGFGSLGRTRWRIPQPHGDRIDLAFIPMLAVSASMQGLPLGCPDCKDRYCGQLLAELIERASGMAVPLVGLFCDPENGKALALYERFGFKRVPDLVQKGNVGMVKKLIDEPHLPTVV